MKVHFLFESSIFVLVFEPEERQRPRRTLDTGARQKRTSIRQGVAAAQNGGHTPKRA
jgi:hypothetical protein